MWPPPWSFFCENVMTKGKKFQDYYNKVVVKNKGVLNARGEYFDLLDLKRRFVNKEVTNMSDYLLIKSIIAVRPPLSSINVDSATAGSFITNSIAGTVGT